MLVRHAVVFYAMQSMIADFLTFLLLLVHRLTASLGCLLRLSPFYETQLNPLLDVLQARQVLQSKLAAGGCGEKGVQKTEVKKLVEEVASKLCP